MNPIKWQSSICFIVLEQAGMAQKMGFYVTRHIYSKNTFELWKKGRDEFFS